jgi:uncharacterized protein YbbC (DUF1343 family)
MVWRGNKRQIACTVAFLAISWTTNAAVRLGIDVLEHSDYAILRGKRAGLIIVASWRSNIASFGGERAPYLIY